MWVKTEDGAYVNDETGNVYSVHTQGSMHEIQLTTPLGGTVNTTILASEFDSKEEAQKKLDELASGFDVVQVHRDDKKDESEEDAQRRVDLAGYRSQTSDNDGAAQSQPQSERIARKKQ